MRRKIRLLIGLLATVTVHLPVATHAAACLAEDPGRPRIALVLGGGGARGVAHIGVIRALEELRVPVDFVAGTSMGALIGGMYATGMSASEIEEVATSIDWSDTFRDNVPREQRPFRRKRDDRLGLYGAKVGLGKDSSVLPRAAITGQKVDFLLESVVGNRIRTDDFDTLPIPFRAVAVDILAGEVAVLDRGNLSGAMRASMSLPAIFDPVKDGDRLLVDGGVLMNLPVSVGRDLGADVIIAVDVGAPLAGEEDVRNIVQILYQLTGVVTVVNTRQQIELLGPDDFLLQPLVNSDIGSASFAESPAAIPDGYAAAMASRERLSALAMSESAWSSRHARIAMCVDGPPVIDFVSIDNRSRFRDEMIRSRIGIEAGDTLDLDSLEQEIQAIYALGFLQSVQYNLVEDNGQTGLEIEVIDDARGNLLFEYGFGINSSSKVSDFILRAGLLKTDIGSRGGEFRGLLQIGQALGGMVDLWLPLGDDLRYIFMPRLIAEQTRFNEFDDTGNNIRQFEISQYLLDVEIGRAFGNTALLSAGIRLGRGDVDVEIGDPELLPLEFDRGEYVLRGRYDSIDNPYFPGSGHATDVGYRVSDQSLGAGLNFQQASIRSIGAWTAGRHNFMAILEYDVSFDDVIPLHNQYRGGGFPRLSGLQYNELLGPNLGIVAAGYRYKLLENSLFPGWLGGTIEYGNVADDRNDVFANGLLNGSVYLGIDSILGPMYLGVGAAEGGRRTYFLTVGSIFNNNTLSGL